MALCGDVEGLEGVGSWGSGRIPKLTQNLHKGTRGEYSKRV